MVRPMPISTFMVFIPEMFSWASSFKKLPICSVAEELRISLKATADPFSWWIMDFANLSQQFWYKWNFLDGTGLGFQMATAIEETLSAALSLVVKFRGLERGAYILCVSWVCPSENLVSLWNLQLKTTLCTLYFQEYRVYLSQEWF